MTSSLANSKEITDPADIAEIFRVAHSHRWPMNYSVMSGQRLTSHSTELVKVEPNKGSITVSSEVKYSGVKPATPVTFRSRSGGICLEFESELIGGSDSLADRLFSECRFKYPDRIQFQQQRSAVRVDCNGIEDILITLFSEHAQLHGKAHDISRTGVKIRLEGNLGNEFQRSRIVSDCQMRLPDGSIMKARLKVLGFSYDEKQNLSFIRCYFLEIHEEKELKLEELINTALQSSSKQLVGF